MTRSAFRMSLPPAAVQLSYGLIKAGAAVWRLRQIAVRAVPGNVALQEQHVMSAFRQRPHQGAIGGGVPRCPTTT